MVSLLEIFAAVLFLSSSGLLFNERFRNSRLLVTGAGAIAIVSTYFLSAEIFHRLTPPRATIPASVKQVEMQAPVPVLVPVPKIREFKDCHDCPDMVEVPGGKFGMGDSRTKDANPDEVPQAEIYVKTFAIGKFKVTRADWARFVEETKRPDPRTFPDDREAPVVSSCTWRDPGFTQTPRDPVVCINRQDALDYLAWLSVKAGRTYRLASEAEWEYAARSRSNTPYWWGAQPSHENANYGAEDYTGEVSGRDRWENTSPVGSFPSNAFGLFDTSGNAYEWVHDCYTPYSRRAVRKSEPYQSSKCEYGMVRGGSFSSPPNYMRSAARNPTMLGVRANTTGLRVAASDVRTAEERRVSR